MAFGIPKIGELTAQLDERFKQLIAKLDEILAELRTQKERGGVPLALIIGIVIVVVLLGGLGMCGDALFEDEDERNDLGLVRVELVSHEYDDGGGYEGDYEGGQNYEDQWSNEDRNRNRGRNRGAFSPGPFDDSPVDAFNGNTICLPGSTCYGDRGDEPPPDEGEPQ